MECGAALKMTISKSARSINFKIGDWQIRVKLMDHHDHEPWMTLASKQNGSGDREKRASIPSSSTEEQSNRKRQKHSDYNYSGVASLPSDVLISILCRSPQSDHEALRNTCKAFRETIDSNEYKGERARSCWAEKYQVIYCPVKNCMIEDIPMDQTT